MDQVPLYFMLDTSMHKEYVPRDIFYHIALDISNGSHSRSLHLVTITSDDHVVEVSNYQELCLTTTDFGLYNINQIQSLLIDDIERIAFHQLY
jgi:hypothetical protein